jgi:CRISP-associated protein Cas1
MEQVFHLQSFGARLRVKDGLFEVSVPDPTGATEYTSFEFAAHTVSTIVLHIHTSLSTDAIQLAAKNRVQIMTLDHMDRTSGFFMAPEMTAHVQTWKQQLRLNQTTVGLGKAREWICLKIRRQIEWIEKLKSYRKGEALVWIETTQTELQTALTKLHHLPIEVYAEAAATIRGIEGSAQRAYLSLLSSLLPEHQRFDGRSRQPADDIFNAAINYGYGMLYNWVEQALWENGLCPYIGLMHADERKQKSLLYDFIEPYRPWVDKSIFNLCSRKELNGLHVKNHLGGIWLNDIGKKIVAEAVNIRFRDRYQEYSGKKFNVWQSLGLEARTYHGWTKGSPCFVG